MTIRMDTLQWSDGTVPPPTEGVSRTPCRVDESGWLALRRLPGFRRTERLSRSSVGRANSTLAVFEMSVCFAIPVRQSLFDRLSKPRTGSRADRREAREGNSGGAALPDAPYRARRDAVVQRHSDGRQRNRRQIGICQTVLLNFVTEEHACPKQLCDAAPF
jgi:hypothetical protein